MPTVIDKWRRLCVAQQADFPLTGQRVVDATNTIALIRPLPYAMTVDHGAEFASKALDECLNVNELATLDEARLRLQTWRQDCNHHRPHGSLGRPTPSEFAAKAQKAGPEVPKLWFRVLRKTGHRHSGRQDPEQSCRAEISGDRTGQSALCIREFTIQPVCNVFTYSATACSCSAESSGHGAMSGEPPCLAAPSWMIALMSSMPPGVPSPLVSYLNAPAVKSAGLGFRAAAATPSPFPSGPWQVEQFIL